MAALRDKPLNEVYRTQRLLEHETPFLAVFSIKDNIPPRLKIISRKLCGLKRLYSWPRRFGCDASESLEATRSGPSESS
jgi:hypothetical protein